MYGPVLSYKVPKDRGETLIFWRGEDMRERAHNRKKDRLDETRPTTNVQWGFAPSLET